MRIVLVATNRGLKKPLIEIQQATTGNISIYPLSGPIAQGGTHYSLKKDGWIHLYDSDPKGVWVDTRIEVARASGYKFPEEAGKYLPVVHPTMVDPVQAWPIGGFGYPDDGWTRSTKYDLKNYVIFVPIKIQKGHYIKVNFFKVPKGTEQETKRWVLESTGQLFKIKTDPPVWFYIKTMKPGI